MELTADIDGPPRILFAISDTGGGHRSGAQAIDAALGQVANRPVERHIVDILASTNFPFLRNAPNLYDQLSTRWLPVYDALFGLTNGTKRMDALTQMVYIGAHRNVLRVLDETRPHVVVSVHPLSNRLIGYARRTYKLSFRFVSVVTDLVTLHAAYADPSLDLIMVPTQEAYDRLIALGIPDTKLLRTGFPVHPKFTGAAVTPLEGRRILNLPLEPFTILLTAGGVGSGNLRDMLRNLARAYPQQQILVVTGKNAVLRKELEQLQLGPLVRIYGFVSNMEQLMAASDLIVTKAGPGTLMEALVMRRPVIVTQAVGTQEQGNIDFVLNHELGAFCPTVDRIVPAVAEMLHADTYAATIARLQNAVPRDGAFQIAHTLLHELELAPPARHRRLRLPTLNEFHLTARRLRIPAQMVRRRLRLTIGATPPAPAKRRFRHWRRSRP